MTTYTGGAGDDIFRLKWEEESFVVDGNAGFDTLILLEAHYFSVAELSFRNGVGEFRYDFQPSRFSGIEKLVAVLGSGSQFTMSGEGIARIDGGDGSSAASLNYSHCTVDLSFNGQASSEGRYATVVGQGSSFRNIDTFGLFGGSGNDKFISGWGSFAANGGAGDDVLIGGTSINSLNGGAGDDWLQDSGSSGDVHGGLGNDTIDYSRDSNWHWVDLGSEHEQFTGFENAVGSRFDDFLIGKAGANILDGNGGDDLVEGEGGDDILKGAAGNDVLRGGTGADWLQGGVGVDELQGDAGDDRLDGSLGNDVADGGAGHDVLLGAAGSDALAGGIGNDRLAGGDNGDTLKGGDGADTLIGGLGRDALEGGVGADLLLFDDGDSSATRSLADTIAGFNGGEGDRISLRGIDADVSTAGADDRFDFVGSSAFSGEAGELRIEVVQGNAFIQGDTNGDAVADFFIRLDGATSVDATFLVL